MVPARSLRRPFKGCLTIDGELVIICMLRPKYVCLTAHAAIARMRIAMKCPVVKWSARVSAIVRRC